MTEKKSTKGTLSLGKISVKSPTAAKSSGVSVEVKKRRFSNPQTGSGKASSVSADGEMARRLDVLKQAEENKAEETAKRAQERAQAEKLSQLKVQEAEEAKLKEQEIAAQKEAEVKAVEVDEQRKRIAEAEAAVLKEERAPKKKILTADEFTGKKKTITKSTKTQEDSRKRTGRNAYLEDLENRYRSMGSKRQKARKHIDADNAPQEKITHEVTIPEVITVQELASRMAEKVSDVIKKLMLMGQMVTQNQSIDQETAALIVEEMGHSYKLVTDADLEDAILEQDENESDYIERAPIVTVMGHVDHGKTSLLDALRKTHVVDGEAGGITQHIGAYQIRTPSGRLITFLDTPGHAAFTSMRARGASVTDVVILVVAADDGVMPQTIEAIQHAKAAEVPIIVAVNKCDKPEANPERVKQELLQHDLIPEEYGGDVTCVNISAKAGTGLEELEEMVLLQADVLELKANPQRRADGVVVESRLDKGRGSVATVIVQRGTLRVGDVLVAGSVWGRVRALTDDKGQKLTEANPAMPVEIQGLNGVCDAGDTFAVTASEKGARELAQHRDQKEREKAAAAQAKSSLDTLFSRIAEGETAKVSVVVKADVQGSVEAITDALNKLSTDEVKVSVVYGAVGVITENDVNLSSASDALIVGFNVRANPQARDAAGAEGIEIRYYNVIYNLVDDVKAAMSGMLSPDFEENVIGRAEIRQVMVLNKIKISGCFVTEGKLIRDGKVRIIRDGVVIQEDQLGTLRRFKDDVKEVSENYECGLTFEKFDDVKEGDEIEAFEMVEIQRSIDDIKAAQQPA